MTQPTGSGGDASAAAQQLLELQSQLRASIHELRNVLASHAAALRMLARCIEHPEQGVVILADLQQQCQQLLDVTQQIAAARESSMAPAAASEQPVVAADDSAPAPAGRAARAEPRRILIVDDNVEATLSLACALRLEGYEVLTAYDGDQAVRIFQDARPSVVVLDIEMPIMNGYEAARQIRARHGSTACRLIGVSGHSDSEDRERALAAGFQAYLTKPIDPEALVRLLGEP